MGLGFWGRGWFKASVWAAVSKTPDSLSLPRSSQVHGPIQGPRTSCCSAALLAVVLFWGSSRNNAQACKLGEPWVWAASSCRLSEDPKPIHFAITSPLKGSPEYVLGYLSIADVAAYRHLTLLRRSLLRARRRRTLPQFC